MYARYTYLVEATTRGICTITFGECDFFGATELFLSWETILTAVNESGSRLIKGAPRSHSSLSPCEIHRPESDRDYDVTICALLDRVARCAIRARATPYTTRITRSQRLTFRSDIRWVIYSRTAAAIISKWLVMARDAYARLPEDQNYASCVKGMVANYKNAMRSKIYSSK